MSNICKVKCGDKEKSIKIQRPSFKSVEKGYREINALPQEQENEAKDLIYSLLITQNYTQLESLQIADYYKQVAARYVKIGGGAYNQFINDMDKYGLSLSSTTIWGMYRRSSPTESQLNPL